MIKKILIFIVVVSTGVLLYSSTFGWQKHKAAITMYSQEQEKVAYNLRQHVSILSDQIGWRDINNYGNLKQADAYITDFFKNFNLNVTHQRLTSGKKHVNNIIAEKKGINYPEKIVIIGAHYDSYSNPGADSNASGVAAMLELARIYSGKQTGVTLRFVAFANAEPPFLGTKDMGSVVYVDNLKQSGKNVEAVIILDSLGYYSGVKDSQRYPPLWGMFYPNKANSIFIIGNTVSFDIIKIIEKIFKQSISLKSNSTVGCDFINSDHQAFWKEKYRAVLITDTGPYRNPHYHSLSDTHEKLNFSNIAQIVYGVDLVVEKMDQ